MDINSVRHAGRHMMQAVVNSSMNKHGFQPLHGATPGGAQADDQRGPGRCILEQLSSGAAGAYMCGLGGVGCSTVVDMQDDFTSETGLVKRMEQCIKVLQSDLSMFAVG